MPEGLKMLTEFVMGIVLPIIQNINYLGVMLLMLAESTLLPIPSEGVLPFAGYLIALGKMEFFTTLAFATMGTIIGATISYYIGKHIGKAAIIHYGKYIMMNEHDLDIAKKWFETHGEKMIFICRFIPAVRHVISIPAGTADMKFKKFILYTAFGGLIWNGILLVVGTQLQKNWDTIIQYSQIIDAVVIAAVILVIIWFFGTKIRNKNKGANKNAKTGKENKKRARRSNNSKSKRIQRKKAKTN